MSGHREHTEGGRRDRVDRDPENRGDDGEDRRTVDEDAPTPDGLTSPGEGADDTPVEPRQSKDYS
jgi:hypothetical protein